MINSQGDPIYAANGAKLDSHGNLIGPSHPNGGINLNIHGRHVNAQGGEHYTKDEFGNAVIVKKEPSQKFKGVLGATKNMIFPGKSLFLDMINRSGGGSGFLSNPNIAMEGAIMTAAPANFTSKAELSDESINKLSSSMEASAERGTERGSNRGITKVSEQSQFISESQSLRTF